MLRLSNSSVRIAGISGSLRHGSYNTMLLNAAKDVLPEGASLEIWGIGDLPLYNEDERLSGPSEPVRRFKERLHAADAILFAVPEYNYSFTGVLKNAIDWASRPTDESPLARKPVAMMGASGGTFGTVRAQLHLRQVCVFCNMFPINKPEVLVREPDLKFSADGKLTDGPTRELLGQLVAELVRFTRQLRAGEDAL
ncbi:NADPH-dependent FMN reductase, partial [mine drainage metagenome]